MFRKKFKIIRQGVGSYNDDGQYVDGVNQDIYIMATVQPLNEKETQALPEGNRTTATVKVYTDTRLFAERQADGVNQNKADYLEYQGNKWKIIACSSYQSGLISHYKAIAQEVTSNVN